jgi:hypothetical protein
MTTIVAERSLADRALETLRHAGNPFRNYFARNPDDEVCARFHVPELFSKERAQLLGVVELYRTTPGTHSEMVPILGNKGAGKTHLLHSIKHGHDGAWQLLVTPGIFQKDSDFLEYLLFQVIDTLLGGSKQKGRRPLDLVANELTRRALADALTAASREEWMDLFPAPGLSKWTRKLGLGVSQAQERTQWLLDGLKPQGADLKKLCGEAQVEPERAAEFLGRHIDRTEPRDSVGLMRRQLMQGFARAALMQDESDLANFLTYGFAELDYKVKPSRQELVLSLFKTLMHALQSLRIPVVVAFDQLEDLLLARRTDDGHRVAETFFAGIVQAMHQIDGICFLVFAERGLWNRFVPSLDGYIQDRLNNPVHVPGHGTIKSLRLEAPALELVRKVVEARLRPGLEEPHAAGLTTIWPFTDEQVAQIAKTEPTLRDMLQQFRHLFDHLVFGEVEKKAYDEEAKPEAAPSNRISQVLTEEPKVKSVVTVETPVVAAPTPEQPKATTKVVPPARPEPAMTANLEDLWNHQAEAARAKLATEGALTGSTRDLQAGLGAFLQTCCDHGVKVGPWRLQHVVPDFAFGDHPTYGFISIGHWACRDGKPWKVGIGLFLGRGTGKPKDLETKLSTLDLQPPMIDHLILLRPDDDMALTGKSKTVWQDAEKKGKHPRLEEMTLDTLSVIYAFPRWIAAIGEALPAGQPLPNLADFIQDKCERLLEQVCMPQS